MNRQTVQNIIKPRIIKLLYTSLFNIYLEIKGKENN